MRNNILLISLICLSIAANAQTNGGAAQGSKYIYCEMSSMTMPASTEVIISVDYGQEAKVSGGQPIRDENGEVIPFNSHIDALNFMADKGWEMVQMYLTGERQSNVSRHWVMKLDKSQLSRKQIEYLMTIFKTKEYFTK